MNNDRDALAPAATRKRQRVMAKKNRVNTVASALTVAVTLAGVGLGIEGCAAAAADPGNPGQVGQSVTGLEARVTGYASSPLTSKPSGPVSVMVRDASAARLDQLINGLHVDNQVLVCAEEAQLYQIDFTVVAGAKRGFDVGGYECGGLVVVTSDGKTVLRTDTNCTLMSAVRRLLPATATATQRLSVPCVS
jgi:hypothetical protein